MSYVNAERNQAIVDRYYSGDTIAELSRVYFLSENMWMWSRETGHQTAAVTWNRWQCGSERKENGQLYTVVRIVQLQEYLSEMTGALVLFIVYLRNVV